VDGLLLLQQQQQQQQRRRCTAALCRLSHHGGVFAVTGC
jgi:hypothetical protein